TKGLNKLLLNKDAITNELNNHWAVVAEAIQTILRRENYPKPYETLKELTRVNNEITKQSIYNFIDSLDLDKTIKNELKAITPYNYVGI
ncbi:MAG: adenylosuccinate lyase, partial [Tannerella sp.]|nr:adenylosuccinate lyase [Tannerella sp.]